MNTKNTASQDHGHHIVPIGTYVKNLIALLVLMGLTIAVSYVHLGSLGNNVVALTIAVIKATLVISIFMGVWYASKLVKLYAIMGFVWVFLLGIMFCDYATRHLEIERGWEGQTQLPVTGMNAPVVDEIAVRNAHVEGESAEH